MSLPTVVVAATAATAAATPASSAAAAANGSALALLAAPFAGPNAAPPRTLPDSVVAAVYGRYGWTVLNSPPIIDSITMAQMKTPMTDASCDLINEPRPTPSAAMRAPASTCPAAYLTIVASPICTW